MLRQLLFSKENCLEITALLLAQLNVRVTDATLKKQLYNHPDYPSLLSINDVLEHYGIESLSFKTNSEKLLVLPTPFIAQIKTENLSGDVFTIINTIKDNSIRYYNPEKHQWTTVSVKNFAQQWTSGIILLPDASEQKDEEN